MQGGVVAWSVVWCDCENQQQGQGNILSHACTFDTGATENGASGSKLSLFQEIAVRNLEATCACMEMEAIRIGKVTVASVVYNPWRGVDQQHGARRGGYI
jgi:hypothetical protein